MATSARPVGPMRRVAAAAAAGKGAISLQQAFSHASEKSKCRCGGQGRAGGGGCRDANIVAQGLLSRFNEHGCRRAADMDALRVALAAGEDATSILQKSLSHALVNMRAGAADMDALAAALVAGEDANFRLFGYVGAVNAEVDALEAAAGELRAEVAAAGDAAAAAEAARQAAARARPRPCAGPPPVGGAQGARMSRSARPDASARAGSPPRTRRYARGSCGLRRGSQTACCPCGSWCALCRDLRKGHFLGVPRSAAIAQRAWGHAAPNRCTHAREGAAGWTGAGGAPGGDGGGRGRAGGAARRGGAAHDPAARGPGRAVAGAGRPVLGGLSGDLHVKRVARRP